MRRELARVRPVPGLAAAALAALAVSLAGCGGSGTSAGPSAGPSGSAGPASAGSPAAGPLAMSHLRILTRLRRSQLCGVLAASEAARILGAATAAPAYSRQAGLGITCRWARRGASERSDAGLSISISAILNWTGAQAVDTKLLRSRPVTVDGHPARAAGKQDKLSWAQVDVALGGDHDPVVEYRAPTLAIALALARAATPGIIALG